MDYNKHNSMRAGRARGLLTLIVVIVLHGIVFSPAANAQGACNGFSYPTTEPIELLGCTEFQPGNGDSEFLTVPGGIAQNDLLLAVVQIDDDDSDATFTMDPYWTPVGAETNANGILSHLYFRIVASPAESGSTQNINWTGGNERFYAFILHFRGAAITADLGTINTNGNDSTPPAPALTTSANDTFVLRTLSLDRSAFTTDTSNLTGFTNITLDNTGNGAGGISGGAAFRYEPVPTTVPAANWGLTGARPSHTRTIGIHPFEFRFAVADGVSSVCGIEQVTLSVTNFAGGALPFNFIGTVDLSPTTSTGGEIGAVWSGGSGGLSAGVNGNATYTFDGSEGGSVTLNYYNPNPGVVDFEMSYRNFTESTSAGYAEPSLNVLDCEFVTSFEAGNEIGTCSLEQVTVSLQDTAGNPATNYSGTMTIDNNNGSGAGSYSFVSGSFGGTFNNNANGTASYSFTITPATPGTPHIVVMDYTHESTVTSNIDFQISDGAGTQQGGGNPTLIVSACEFRISYSGTAQGSNSLSDTCTPTEVTITVVDETGAPISGYAGTIRITNNQTIGSWSQSVVTGTLDNASGIGTNDGQADYTFSPGENGSKTFDFSVLTDVGPNIDFQIVEISTSTFIASPSGIYDADVDIAPCTFDFQISAGAGSCVDAQSVTVTIRDRGSNPVPDYIGQIQIQADNGDGDFTLVDPLSPGGLGTPDNGAGGGTDNGVFTYTFDASDNGFLDLEYATNVTGAPVTFTVTSLSSPSGEVALDAGSQTVTTYSDCDLVITLPDANLIRNVCTMTRVSFEVQVNGATLPNFDGEINISTSAAQGKWFENLAETYPGTLSGGGVGNGTATYDFDGTEGGAVILDFRNAAPIKDLSFSASGTASNGAPITFLGPAPEIDIFACTLTITTASVSNTADVCRGGESVTYTLDTPGTTNFTGTMVLQTSSGFGNYVQTSGNATLVGPGGNDGFATYTFDALDGGVLTVDYSVLAVPPGDTVTMLATIPDFTVVNTDATLTYRACEFRISYPSDTAPFETDVCSIKQVRIEIVDGAGSPATVDDYTGTVNLTTSTGFGSWSENPADNDGLLSDPFGEDGAASYTFVDSDDGVVLLNFTHTAASAASLNINVTDSKTSDPGTPGSTYDPNLLVDLCTFRISFDGGVTSADASISACTVQSVTIEVIDSSGTRALDYAGQINLSTSTGNGNWSNNTGNGSLSGAVVDGGEVSYTFNDDGIGGDDDGLVTLDFSNVNAETVNFDVVDEVIALGLDGVMVEEGASDPNLVIGSCIPVVAERVCAVGGSPLNISLPITAQASDPDLQGRMVAVGTVHEGEAVVNSVSFNGVTFNVPGQAQLLKDIRLDEAGTTDSYTSLWAMNEQLLPTAAASYNVVVNHTDTSLAACAFFLTDVEQTFPAEDLGTPDNGQINATSSADDNVTVASTTVTTTENNALILSLVGIGNPADTTDVSPSPPMVNFSPQPSDPAGAGFGGASGNSSIAAAITINQTMSINPTYRHTHIVAAFNPLISGPPVAEGYEPVVLFKTYSGNISYRAIGASFQTAANTSNVCSLVGSNMASATLDLPDSPDGVMAASGDVFSAAGEFDSDVRAAWLYWFASGSFDTPTISGTAPPVTNNNVVPANFDNVTFTTPDGMGGTNTTNITADELFTIENVGSFSNGDYYVGYKDVTSLMVGTDNELVGSDEDPNGVYTLSNLEIDDGQPWLARGSCAGGFALVVVYDNPYEQLRVINLFHGFQPFQNSSFTLVPRNFRMAERDPNTQRPNGQVTHITVEGDAGLSGADEGLTLQETPNDFDPNDFNALTTDFNPQNEEFNGTITRPIYTLQDPDVAGTGVPGEYFYLFQPNAPDGDDPTGGNPSNGYELDFPNPTFFDGTFDPPSGTNTQYGTSYGVDIDTHFIDGDSNTDLLWEFADPLNPAEEITTRYSADQDLVLLVAEIISVTNADLADIEVTISEADAEYKVNSIGNYEIEVKNNGSGATAYGTATGYIELVGELPAGMSFAGGAVTGSGWTCSNNANAFTCFVDLPGPAPAGLDATPLPLVNAAVTIAGPPGNFPSLNNSAKLIVRVQHSDGSCLGGSIGILPTPSDTCRSPEFDNVNDLQGGALDINDIDDKSGGNNNVDSITTNVRGIETDLSVVKSVTTILEEGSSDSILYTITVTNNGPDDIVGTLTQPAITLTDNEPVGVNFDSATGDDWTCNVNAGAPDQLVCTFDNSVSGVPIVSGANSVITVVGDVTGTSPDPVTNTAQVTAGTYNFDQVPGNNNSQTTDNISPIPAAVTDRFLLSVSAIGNVSLGSGGGLLSNFNENDIVLYDPQTDSAELFIDSQTTVGYEVTNPNAVHLQPNGQVVLSASGVDDEIGTNDLVFQPEDIVLYDRLLNTATLLFDGSAHLTDLSGGTIPLNIDAVYVLDDGSIIFSTAGPASGDRTGGGTESWSDSDLVRYDPTDDTFLVYLDAEDDNVFGAVDAQVDAAYLRVDPADATIVLDTFVLSSAVQGAVLGDNNVIVGRDDVAEIEITGGTPAAPTASASTNLFNGGIPVGVFDTTDPALTLNALHLIEPAHLGHYEISEVVAGNACTPARIRIRKHLGSSHDLDTNYTGSIVISTDAMPANGIWVLDTGQGVLDNSYGGSSDNGLALYTFYDDGPGGGADDDGEVILTLDVTESTPVVDSVNISVTNGFTVDGDTGDNPFEFNLVSTDVDYRDDFSAAAYNNSDGSAGWSEDWIEIDAFDGMSPTSGNGLLTGNIQMTGGKLSLTSNSNTDGGAIDPSMARAAGLGFFDYTEPVQIKFNYGYQSVTNSGDELELQISNDGINYITVKTYNTLDGSSVSDIAETVDVSAFITNNPLDDMPDDPNLIVVDGTDTDLYVRFVITQGYVLGTFTVDNFQVTTSTTSCNTAGLVHYHIDIPATGLACVTSNVTITGHDFGHNPVPIPNGTLLTLTTENGSGSWVNTIGTGTLTETGTITDGQATYELTGGAETSIGLQFNYTDPAGDGAAVNINVGDGALTEVQDGAHDPSSTFDEVGLVFFDQDAGNLSTTLPFQIAGKPSLTAPASGNVTLQIVRSVPIPGENAAAACESLVDDGDVVTVTLAGLCVDPMGCDAGASTMTIFDSNAVAQPVPVFSSPTANPEQQVTAADLTLQFSDLGLAIDGEQNIGAPINFIYPNSGVISLHAEYEIPLDNDTAGVPSGDTINGASETFVVRPFGFDIDFSDDRSTAGGLSLAADADGPAFARAGVGFNATVSAVLWEQADDLELVDGSPGNDGIPDFEADLSNNAVATNFGDEASDNNTVVVSVIANDPTNGGALNPGVPGGVAGVMVVVDGSSDVFQAFSEGVSGPQAIAINEVGIFDLAAELVDDNINRRPINYYDPDYLNYSAVEGVAGGARNVGRIYPNNFELVDFNFGPRTNQSASCSMTSPFTYMGEDFYVDLELQAKNFQGTTTQNYFDDFAKLTSFAELDMRAIVDVDGAADDDLTTRLVNTSVPDNFDKNQVVKWVAGGITLSGDMNIARLVSGEDGPLTDVQIAFSPNDNNVNDGDADDMNAANDVLLDVFDVDLDDGAPDVDPGVGPWQYAEIATHEFRYGRLLVENAYGSEFEDLEIGIVAEYYDGSNFVVNTADSCTAIALTFPAAQLDFVPGSYEDGGGGDTFEAGDTVIENGVDATITLFEGRTARLADGDDNPDNDTDRPFFTTAPANEETGRVLVELDLDPNDDDSPSSLHFLEYDWRGGAGEDPGDPFDEEPEGANYEDNPRAIIEFGSYRGHDRVINWQEIYIGPGGI